MLTWMIIVYWMSRVADKLYHPAFFSRTNIPGLPTLLSSCDLHSSRTMASPVLALPYALSFLARMAILINRLQLLANSWLH